MGVQSTLWFFDPSVEEALSKLFYFAPDKEALDTYADYLTYRVQRALYALCKKTAQFADLSWSDFVQYMRGWPRFLRRLDDPAQWQTLRMAFHDALSRLDFKPIRQAEDLDEAAAKPPSTWTAAAPAGATSTGRR